MSKKLKVNKRKGYPRRIPEKDREALVENEDGNSGGSVIPRTTDDSDHSQSDIDESISQSRSRSPVATVNNTPRMRKFTMNRTRKKKREKLEEDPAHDKSKKTKRDLPEPEPKRILWTEGENRVLIQYLIDNDAIPRARGPKVWEECLEACKPSLHSSRTARSLSIHFMRKLRYDYGKYTDDLEALRKFKEVEIGKPMKGISSLPWTEAEDRVLVQYLIDNDAIHRAKGEKVWHECLEARRSFFDPSRTASSLGNRFSRYLRDNYANYTDNAEALKKFKQNEEVFPVDDKGYVGVAWAEEEDRTLLQYIIENDAIHRVRGLKVWTECLEACKSSLHAGRTAGSLRSHFKRLRLKYAKFLDTPVT